MSLTLKCPHCGSRDKVPDRFLGTKVRCLVCEGKFKATNYHVYREESEKITCRNPGETDKIVLFGCRTCTFLGFIPNSYKSSTIRCPSCDRLSSLEETDDAGDGPEDPIGPPSAREVTGPRTSPPPLPEADWYYSRDGRELGPIALVALKTMADTAQLAPTDLVWKTGMAEWQTAATAGLFPRGTPPHLIPKPVVSIPPPSSVPLGLS
jgi:sarcosine oxidase delta subunit